MSFFKHGPKWGKTIIGLDAKEYEHQGDSASLLTLKSNEFFGKVIKAVSEYTAETAIKIVHIGSGLHVTEHNMPFLNRCVQEACRILNISEVPNIYVIDDPHLNSYTQGIAHPIICLNNSLIDRFTHEELMFVIGHELGHIKSAHCQYQVIERLILNQSLPCTNDLLSSIPFVGDIIAKIYTSGQEYLFAEWKRKSELTADRAGLLVCQNLRAAISALAKMGGYPIKQYRSMDINEYLKQAQDFDDDGQLISSKFVKLLYWKDFAYISHPWTVQRARELMLWVQDGGYSRVMFRSSPWLEKQIQSAANATKKAIENHDKKQEAVEKMAERSGKHAEKGILKKQEKLVQATEKMEAVQFSEQTLREIYRETTPEEIARHIKKTVGNLKEMRPKKVEKAEEQNVEE